MIRFRVAGTPAPQGSKRHVGGGRMVEASARVTPWREAVRAEAQRVLEPLGGFTPEMFSNQAVAVTVVFVFGRPKSHLTPKGALTKSAPGYPVARRRNDLDKLIRSTLDALVDGGVMADDSQVASINAGKVYGLNGEVPGAVIEVEAL